MSLRPAGSAVAAVRQLTIVLYITITLYESPPSTHPPAPALSPGCARTLRMNRDWNDTQPIYRQLQARRRGSQRRGGVPARRGKEWTGERACASTEIYGRTVRHQARKLRRAGPQIRLLDSPDPSRPCTPDVRPASLPSSPSSRSRPARRWPNRAPDRRTPRRRRPIMERWVRRPA